MPRKKSDIITFKVDNSLRDLLQGIHNRSEFIRTAILSALDSACPLCKGTGVLTPKQKQHWEVFAQDHAVRECKDCHEFHLTCSAESEEAPS
jgi:hypothetical protein